MIMHIVNILMHCEMMVLMAAAAAASVVVGKRELNVLLMKQFRWSCLSCNLACATPFDSLMN